MAGTESSTTTAGFWGQENTLDQAKIAVTAQLEQTGQHFPRCEIRPSAENEGGGYLVSFSDFPGVDAAREEAIRRGVAHSMCSGATMMRPAEIPKVDG
jgi:hypothetical protein